MPKMRLLNPGPVIVTERVRAALQREDLCHREPEFSALQDDIRERLTRVCPEAVEDYTTVLLTGSVTTAVEARVGSLVPCHGKSLVAANGIDGERASAMLTAQGIPVDTVKTGWTDPRDCAEVDRRLSRAHD
jgi:2-aminoethylphosphonate-pyruvate transaminase